MSTKSCPFGTPSRAGGAATRPSVISPSATSRWRRAPLGALRGLAVGVVAAAVAVLAVEPAAIGCGGTPPPPMCGKTTTLTKTPPLVFLIAPAGGVVLFPVTVGVGSTGPCPPPVSTTVTLAVTCLPPPGAGGAAVIPTPAPGAWPGVVPVVIPPGPPRVCTVSGTATTLWADGTTSVGLGDTVFCVVEPSPINPSLPRLDLQRLTPPIQSAHPGDQRSHIYRLVNNDPDDSVTVTLAADSEQVARFPGGAPPPVGSPNGFYSISDPGNGDNFPIAFLEDLPPDGCVPLPPDPPSFLVPTISKTVTLLPGQSRVVGIAQRSWPMCGCGSACESRVMVDGTFSDGTPALACSGAGLSVDCLVPPDFDWPDSGANGPVVPVGPALATTIQMPTHTIAAHIGAETIIVGSQPLIVNTNATQTDQFRSRINASGVSPGGPPAAQVGQPINCVSFVEINPSGGDSTWSLQGLGLHLAAPGFNDNYFLLNAHSKVQGPGIPPTVDSFFDVFQVVSLDGISDGLHRKGRIMPGSIVLQPVGPTSYSMGFTGVFDPQPGLPPVVQTVNLRIVGQAIATGVPAPPGPCATADHGCLTQGGPGCDVAACCNIVCALDPHCCQVAWDQNCVKQAFDLCDVVPPPSNDECAHAIAVNDGATYFTTFGATTSGPPLPPECDEGFGLSLDNDIWFSSVAAGTGKVHVSTCQSDFDTRIAVYDDCPGSPNGGLLACSDDSCGFQSSVTFDAVCGQSYVIRVGGYGGAVGAGFLAIESMGECPSSCPTDVNGDGQTDGADLGVTLAEWGGPGAADFNGDGIVDGADLGIQLAAWGPCAGPTLQGEYDAAGPKITYKLSGGTPGRKYTVAGGNDGMNIQLTEALKDLTADVNGNAEASSGIKCKDCVATGGSVTIKLIQSGFSYHEVTMCFKCQDVATPPAAPDWKPVQMDCP